MKKEIKFGVPVMSRDGKITGTAPGNNKACMMEGCRGRRVFVRWPDGTVTWPCSKGMRWIGSKMKII